MDASVVLSAEEMHAVGKFTDSRDGPIEGQSESSDLSCSLEINNRCSVSAVLKVI